MQNIIISAQNKEMKKKYIIVIEVLGNKFYLKL